MEIANSANVIAISPHGQANRQVVDHGPVSRIASLPVFAARLAIGNSKMACPRRFDLNQCQISLHGMAMQGT